MKTKIIRIRMTPREYEQIKFKAQATGLNVSAFLRLIALQSNIIVSTKQLQ